MVQTANEDAETGDVGRREMPVVRPQPPSLNIGSKSGAALEITPKSSAPAVGTQQPRRSPQIGMKSRLAEEAVKKLRDENPDWKGIDYIMKYGEGVGSESNKTNGKFTVKELLDGMDELQKRRREMEDTEQNIWKRLKIGERIDKSAGVLTHFLSAGDVAVSFDPVHAALPWAAIRVVLVVSGLICVNPWPKKLTRQLLTSHTKVHNLVIACFHEVALLVFQCESYEQLYLHEARPTDATIKALESAVVAAYCESLLFLASACRYANQGSAPRFATAPSKLSKMADHLSGLSNCISKLSHCSGVCQAEYSNRALTRLQQCLLNATEKLEDLDKNFGNFSQLL